MSTRHNKEKARVNITLDIDQNGAKKSMELPLSMLVMDDFSHGKNAVPIAERKKIAVTKNSLNHALKEISPEISFTVDNHVSSAGGELDVHLAFNKMEDFRPEGVVQQVPVLKKILAMRLLLKELRSNVSSQPDFRKILQTVMQDPNALEALRKQLPAGNGEKS